jgi:hypothetical protein
MTGTRKSHNDLACSNGARTVHDLFVEHEETSHLITENSAKNPVAIIVLCDSAAPFDEEVLGATPHITMRMEDDLLQNSHSR